MAENATHTERRVTPGLSPRIQAVTPKTWPLLVIRILATVGLCIATYLSVLHYQAGVGGTIETPLCKISSALNCNAVLGSSYSRLFGVPVATWAALTYAAILGVSFLGSTSILVFLCSWSFVFSLYMAGLSFFTLKAVCLFCTSLYATNIGLFIGGLALTRQARDFSFVQLGYSLVACVVVAFTFGWAQAQLEKARTGFPSENAVAKDFPETYNKLRQVSLNIGERNTKGSAQAAVTISEFVDFR